MIGSDAIKGLRIACNSLYSCIILSVGNDPPRQPIAIDSYPKHEWLYKCSVEKN